MEMPLDSTFFLGLDTSEFSVVCKAFTLAIVYWVLPVFMMVSAIRILIDEYTQLCPWTTCIYFI